MSSVSAAGRGTGNSRNGTRTKTVLTDVGPVEIGVPRDRDAALKCVYMAIMSLDPTGAGANAGQCGGSPL